MNFVIHVLKQLKQRLIEMYFGSDMWTLEIYQKLINLPFKSFRKSSCFFGVSLSNDTKEEKMFTSYYILSSLVSFQFIYGLWN